MQLMHLPRYEYTPDETFTTYEFFSEGPNGTIRKIIVFTEAVRDPVRIYNLGFGDVDEETGDIDDAVTSNNADRDMVLATVAASIHEFCNRHGNHLIYATGSSPARTRLYQMSISRHYGDLCKEFDIKGFRNGGWEPFQKNVNYEAFLANRL
jgi:hypothetical protein